MTPTGADWQPARIIPAEHDGAPLDSEMAAKSRGKLVRIRETQDRYFVSVFGSCDASRFFEVHPDDARKQLHHLFHGGWSGRVIVCDHEILTD